MPRAIITAQALFNEKYNIIKDDRFIEFDLHFIQIPFIKLKFETWALISRILWFMGMLKTKKSVRSELLRAKNNANFLCDKARKNNVVLVSHGLLNMFIERDLKKQGYKRVSKITNGFFSTIKLEHTVVNN